MTFLAKTTRIASTLGLAAAALIFPRDGISASATVKIDADSTAVLAVLAGFQKALGAGDSIAAVALLDSQLVVLESGELETRQEYVAHHLRADMAFAKAVSSSDRLHSVRVQGDAAWIASTSQSRGTFNGRAVDSNGAELVVLRKTPKGWRIAAIHWSSRRRAPA